MLAELEVVEMLCKGIDPRTGEILDTPKNPEVDTARLKFFDRLKRLNRKVAPRIPRASKASQPANTEFPNRGRKWGEAETQKLHDLWKTGSTLDQIAPEFGRTTGALCARLARDKVAEDREAIRAENVRRGGEYGKT